MKNSVQEHEGQHRRRYESARTTREWEGVPQSYVRLLMASTASRLPMRASCCIPLSLGGVHSEAMSCRFRRRSPDSPLDICDNADVPVEALHYLFTFS